MRCAAGHLDRQRWAASLEIRTSSSFITWWWAKVRRQDVNCALFFWINLWEVCLTCFPEQALLSSQRLNTNIFSPLLERRRDGIRVCFTARRQVRSTKISKSRLRRNKWKTGRPRIILIVFGSLGRRHQVCPCSVLTKKRGRSTTRTRRTLPDSVVFPVFSVWLIWHLMVAAKKKWAETCFGCNTRKRTTALQARAVAAKKRKKYTHVLFIWIFPCINYIFSSSLVLVVKSALVLLHVSQITNPQVKIFPHVVDWFKKSRFISLLFGTTLVEV